MDTPSSRIVWRKAKIETSRHNYLINEYVTLQRLYPYALTTSHTLTSLCEYESLLMGTDAFVLRRKTHSRWAVCNKDLLRVLSQSSHFLRWLELNWSWFGVYFKRPRNIVWRGTFLGCLSMIGKLPFGHSYLPQQATREWVHGSLECEH